MPDSAIPLNAAPEAWLAAIVESSDDAIVSKTLDSIIRSWNLGAERMFGYTAAEAIGKSIRMLIPDELQDEEDMILARIRAGHRVDHFETVRRRKDGQRIDVSITVSPIRGTNGDIVGASKIARDISETKRLLAQSQDLQVELEQQLEESMALQTTLEETNEALHTALRDAQTATATADRANQAKSNFLAMMSHELRTPLNAILGYADLLEVGVDGPVTDAQQAHISRIRVAGKRLLGLIEDVLDLAKLESGRLTFEITDVPINDILASLGTFVEPHLMKRDVTYRVHPCLTGLVARGDAAKIEQILLNLLSNAVKFTERGRIDVSCHAQNDKVHIEVADTGRGMSAAFLETIFEPFVQEQRQLTRNVEGTGLGLSISRKLARGMGADVTVQSTEGSGSTFTLTLPLSKEN